MNKKHAVLSKVNSSVDVSIVNSKSKSDRLFIPSRLDYRWMDYSSRRILSANRE